MIITGSTLVADIATANPATIKVFQRHQIEFCCAGRVPLAEVCDQEQLDAEDLIAELDAALVSAEQFTDWTRAPVTDLAAHIQRRFHRPLRAELPRLHAMADKVVRRHGERRPETYPPLHATFVQFEKGMTAHLGHGDGSLFATIAALDAGEPAAGAVRGIDQVVAATKNEHASAAVALRRMAELTDGYVPPGDACPTLRGLFYGLSELERDTRVHIELEERVLLPRVAAIARARG
jgi:regulator of cell morphogenesis and NO signaling